MDLSASLDKEVLQYRSHSFAASTSKTYSTQLTTYMKFYAEMNVKLVPLSQENLGRYIAFLSRRLCFNSVRQYLNIVRLVHLEANFNSPLEKNWYVTSVLKGVRRVKGDSSVQKLPIMLDILKQIFTTLNLHSSFDRTFWAACLVGFFSFFRKSNLFVQSHLLFDPGRNLCASDLSLTADGAIITVRWKKLSSSENELCMSHCLRSRIPLFAPLLHFCTLPSIAPPVIALSHYSVTLQSSH